MKNDQLIDSILNKKTTIKFQLKKYKNNIHKLFYKIEKIKLDKGIKLDKDAIKKINKKYFYKTYNIDTYKTVKCNNCLIPSGMYIFKQLYTQHFRINVFNELEKTFNNNKNDPSFKYYNSGKKIFLFDNMNIFKIIKYANSLNTALYNILYKIIVDIFSNLQIKKDNIENILNLSKLVIIRYEKDTGIYTHIDNIKRSDGLVLTLSFGAHYTVYDLIPLDNKKDSLRIEINECEPVIMDGLSRFIYAHAIPNNLDYYPNKIRYSMVFLISNYNQINCKMDNKFFNIQICEQNDYKKYK
jgi:hypothetical protein